MVNITWPKFGKLWPEVVPTLRWLIAALVSSVGLSLIHSPIAPLPGVVTILVVPGAALLSLLHTRPLNAPARVVLSVCLSMMIIMLEGLVASLILSPLGVRNPLAATTQIVIWTAIAIVILVVCAIQRRYSVSWALDGITTQQVATLLASGVLILIADTGRGETQSQRESGSHRCFSRPLRGGSVGGGSWRVVRKSSSPT